MYEDYLSEGPTHLQIEPTSRCNFTCSFCAGRHMPQGDLTFERFQSVVDQLPTLRYLHLQGEGEPLLNREFFRMARHARERGLILSLITNGSLLNESAIDQLLELEFSWVGVSLETLDRDRFKLIRGGLLDKVLANIRELIRARDQWGREEPIVTFVVTVLVGTVAEADRISALSKKLGMGPPYFQPLQAKHDYARFYSKHLLDQIPSTEMLEPIRRLEKEHQKWREDHNFRNYYDELWKDWQGPGCAFVARSMYVEHSGHFTPCCMIKDHEHPRLGNMSELPIAEIWHSPARFGINSSLQAGQVPASCLGCIVTAKGNRDES